jgi:hypothetical protein
MAAFEIQAVDQDAMAPRGRSLFWISRPCLLSTEKKLPAVLRTQSRVLVVLGFGSREARRVSAGSTHSQPLGAMASSAFPDEAAYQNAPTVQVLLALGQENPAIAGQAKACRQTRWRRT